MHNLTVDLYNRHNYADARTQLLAMSRTAKMRARPTHLTKGSNPHRAVWTHPVANCTVAWRMRSFHLCQSRCQGSSSQGFSEGKNHGQATSSFSLAPQDVPPFAHSHSSPFLSVTSLNPSLTSSRLTRPSINHFTSFTRTSFNQSATFPNLPSPSRLPDFATRQASPNSSNTTTTTTT